MPGVSTSRPPPGSTCSSRAVVVCRPRPSSRISRVAASVSPARALARLDFPTPDGPTIAAVRPGAEQRADGVESVAGHRADGQHLDAERVLGHLLDGGRDVVAQVGLREDDDRRRPAAPGDGEVALHPPQPRLPDERVDDEDDVEVRRDDLGARRAPGHRADEGAPAGQDRDGQLAAQGHPVPDRRTADVRAGAVVEGGGRDDRLLPLGGQHAEPAAVDAGHPAGCGSGRELDVPVGRPAERCEFHHARHGAPQVSRLSSQL